MSLAQGHKFYYYKLEKKNREFAFDSGILANVNDVSFPTLIST